MTVDDAFLLLYVRAAGALSRLIARLPARLARPERPRAAQPAARTLPTGLVRPHPDGSHQEQPRHPPLRQPLGACSRCAAALRARSSAWRCRAGARARASCLCRCDAALASPPGTAAPPARPPSREQPQHCDADARQAPMMPCQWTKATHRCAASTTACARCESFSSPPEKRTAPRASSGAMQSGRAATSASSRYAAGLATNSTSARQLCAPRNRRPTSCAQVGGTM